MSALVFRFDGSGVRVNGTMLKPAGDRFGRPEPEVRVVQGLAEGRLIAFHATSIPGEMSQMVIVCPNAGARGHGISPLDCRCHLGASHVFGPPRGRSAGWCGPIRRCPALNAGSDVGAQIRRRESSRLRGLIMGHFIRRRSDPQSRHGRREIIGPGETHRRQTSVAGAGAVGVVKLIRHQTTNLGVRSSNLFGRASL